MESPLDLGSLHGPSSQSANSSRITLSIVWVNVCKIDLNAWKLLTAFSFYRELQENLIRSHSAGKYIFFLNIFFIFYFQKENTFIGKGMHNFSESKSQMLSEKKKKTFKYQYGILYLPSPRERKNPKCYICVVYSITWYLPLTIFFH